MKSAATAMIGVLLLVSSIGCTICDSSLDNNYAAFGGLFERTDQHGRVGSTFSRHLPMAGQIGSVTPSDPETNSSDRPRDLSEDDLSGGTTGEDAGPQGSGFDRDNEGDAPTDNSIPEFDSGDFEELLNEIPGSDDVPSFPGDVNLVPTSIDLETPSAIQLVSAEQLDVPEGDERPLFSLAERMVEITNDQLDEIVADDIEDVTVEEPID